VGRRPDSLLVWGAGGHGRVVADLARAMGLVVSGYVDSNPTKLGQVVDAVGGKVVLLERDVLQGPGRKGSLESPGYDCVALGIGVNATRMRCLSQIGDRAMPAMVHPRATVSSSVSLGIGTVVMAGAVVNADVRIGRGVIVNSGAIVEHDCVLADGTHVSPGAVLTGGVQLETESWVGAGAVVLNAVCIGERSVVGAGAVVVRDVEPGQTVIGVPARELTRRSDE
jgi:sugar O-acyltransferase (sialic acid O-acetyltransferase NeuD family)